MSQQEPADVGRLAPLKTGRGAATSADRIRSLASGLRRAAATLEIVAVVAAAVGVVAGIVLVFVTSEEGFETTHPYVGMGFALAGASVVSGMFNWCVARALHLFAEHIAAVHSTGSRPLS
jgi:hypothetical protein